MASRPEISEDPESIVVENTIVVAVGTDENKNRSLLSWALQNSGGKRICILFVDQPVRWINILGANTPVSAVQEEIVRDEQEKKRQRTIEIANQYILFCGQRGVQAQKLLREADCVKKEIVEVIRLHKIKHLVMEAKLRRHCTRMDLRSQKARYVSEHAPVWCRIQFVSRGNFVVVREATAESDTTEDHSSPTSVIDIECNYEERDGSMFGTHSSAMRSSSIDGSLEIRTLYRTTQQAIAEVAERTRHMGQEAEAEIGGQLEVLRRAIQGITKAGLAKEGEVQEVRSQFAALQGTVNELQVERDNLLREAEGLSLV